MPSAKRFKCYVNNSKFKNPSYKLSPSLFSLALLSLILSLYVSEPVSDRKIHSKCCLHLQLYKSMNSMSALTANVNFYARYTFGNRTSRGVRLCHWNAGNAFLKNKMNSIENVINRFTPHILGISEANLLKSHDKSEVQLPNYELITSFTMDNPNLEYSRVVVYKHSSIISKVRSDLMSPDFSSVWLECGLPKRKKF